MSHAQYPIISDLEGKQPSERLLYISSSTFGEDWISMFHSHSFNEFIYVLDGKGTFCSEEDRIPIEKDSFVIINPNVRHTETSSDATPLRYIVLGIDNLQFQFRGDEQADLYSVFDMKQHKYTLLPLLNAMLEEARHEKEFYIDICQHYLSVFLLQICRITGDSYSLFDPSNIPGECQYIKHYIDSNYHQDITLDLLSELTHRNKFYLSHMFTASYGTPPINYLLERRILHSKNLLKNSDYSITQIARMTGFSSSNYFSQCFKKSIGIPPRKYRLRQSVHSEEESG